MMIVFVCDVPDAIHVSAMDEAYIADDETDGDTDDTDDDNDDEAT